MGSLACVASGCAFSEGDPWGEASMSLVLSFDGDSRLTDEGHFKTSKDYVLEIDTLTLELASARLSLAGEAASTFDPSAPPPGYSLCHNGHCHHDSGALVDYEDIAAELAGTAGGGPVALQAIEERVVLGDGPVTVPLGVCDGCALEPGFLRSVTLLVSALELEGRVSSIGDRDLPSGAVDVRGVVPLNVSFERAVLGEVGRGEPVHVGVEMEFELSEKLFDGVEWGSIGTAQEGERIDAAEAAPAIAEKIEEESELRVTIVR